MSVRMALVKLSALAAGGVVIGGGATGLGTALDAQARGYRTLLLDAADFANQLDRLFGAQDLLSAARHLHTIKGLSATVGAIGMATIAKTTEDTIKENGGFASLALRRDFRAAVQITMEALSKACAAMATESAHAQQPSTSENSRAQTLEELQRLQALLRLSDMDALQAYSRLAASHALTPEAIDGLNQSITRLDFLS